MRHYWIALCLVAAMSPAADAPAGHDWFVRAGAEGGDGTQAKPFADPWQALEKVEANDAVHIAAGKYFGKLGLGTWAIPFDGVQLIGGYSADFTARDPWTTRTELLWDKTSKNWPKDARLMSNSKNIVVDGIVIDMKEQNSYTDEACSSRKDKYEDHAMQFSQPATVRNCVIINPGFHGIDCFPGSLIENNLIVNAMDWGVLVSTDDKKSVVTIRNNTILFPFCFKAPGSGRYSGAAIALRGPATITNNILAYCDNNAIYLPHDPAKVSITKNVFAMNQWSNLGFEADGKKVFIDNKSMDQLEDIGLKACDGNDLVDPKLELDKAWMDMYSQRKRGQPGKVEMDDWNSARQLLGLPIMEKGGAPSLGFGAAWPLESAMKLLEPKNPAVKAGARRVKIEVKLSGAVAAAPAKDYPKGDLLAWCKQPDTVNGKPMEMVVAISGVANISTMPAQYDQTKIVGTNLYDAQGQERVIGFMMKGTNAERTVNDVSGEYQGSGKPAKLFVARGICYALQGYPKAAFFIESIARLEAAAAVATRPQGRDWFVRAGSAGGNGSKEKPFKDPFQPLERCESGDTIHIAEGDYFGKLRAGIWRIDTTYISLIGGYDKEFTERNPWKHPTRLFCPEDFKGTRGGYYISGDMDDHTGAVVDGLIFDKRPNNTYKPNGDIAMDAECDRVEDIWLNRPGCVIRNCVFLNGVFGALRVCNGQLIENNIFINHYQQTVVITHGHTDAPTTFRNNTLLFAWDIKFGEGRGRGGHLLKLDTDVRAIVDNNIFEFADNDAIQLNADPREVELTNNVFSHNLWSAVQKMAKWEVVDAKNWKQLADFGFKKLDNNQLMTAGIPLDEKWFNIYLNRTAYVPGKVTMDDWNQIREILGQPVIATGGKGPEGFMPAYDWKLALTLFPKNPQCKAGARAAALPVKFEGIARADESAEYEETTWDVAKNADAWAKLAGKRVSLKVQISSLDNQYKLDDIKQEQYQAFMARGPEGVDSGGQALRCYVKKGTRCERAVQQTKGMGGGRPEGKQIIKGIARPDRQMVVEVDEKADD